MAKRRNVFRRRPGHGTPHGPERIQMTPEGFPAAGSVAPPVSKLVFVSDESRRRYPWLPGRVIAWSVWRGPAHVRVQIDEDGNAVERGTRPALGPVT